MELVRGQRVKVADLTPATAFDIGVEVRGLVVEVLCLMLDAEGKLPDARHVITVTQRGSPCGAVSALGARGQDIEVFRIALDRLPDTFRRLVVSVAVIGSGNLGSVASGQLRILAGGAPVALFRFTGHDLSGEKALSIGELYFKDVWRFTASAQGFQGGRDQLFAHFGGNPAQVPVVAAGAAPPPPAPVPPPDQPPPSPPPPDRSAGGGGFMGWVRSMSSGLKDAVSRYQNDAFAEAVAAACAMVAAADGTISPDEKQKMAGFIQRSEELKVFEMSDLIQRFQGYAKAFEFEPASGRVGALRGIARLKGNAAASKLLVRVCCAIGAADGNFDDQEKAAVRAIILELALDPAEFPDLR